MSRSSCWEPEMSPSPVKLTVGAVRLAWESFCYFNINGAAQGFVTG